jgi:hypothetical protein
MGRPLWREDGSVFYNVQYTVYFTVSDLRPGPCIYIPQEQGGPVIPQGTGYLPLLSIPNSSTNPPWLGSKPRLAYNLSARTT